jgi:hypothetical protein
MLALFHAFTAMLSCSVWCLMLHRSLPIDEIDHFVLALPVCLVYFTDPYAYNSSFPAFCRIAILCTLITAVNTMQCLHYQIDC